jgi:hypothetical protein
MGRNIRKNRVVRRVVTPLFVGCMALGVPTVAVLGSPASAGAATHAAASADPIGALVANLEANVNYYECITLWDIQHLIQPGGGGFCIPPPPLG